MTDIVEILMPGPITTVEVSMAGTQGPQGVQGIQGIQGNAGADGRTILYGAVSPTTEGANGDFYINTATSTLFGPKAAGAWPAGTPLIGPQGVAGNDGADGADGADGNTILYGTAAPTTEGVDGDFYIRTSTSMLYGPKAGGAWPAGTSLIGPQGPTGPAGSLDGLTATHVNTALGYTAADAADIPANTGELTEGSNLYFTAARVRDTVLTGLSTAAATIVDATHTVLQAIGFLQKQVSDNLTTLTNHTGNTSNPHSVTKTQVGLGNVDNTSDATKNAAAATLTNKTLSSFTNSIDADEIHIQVRNTTGSTIAKGTPVYITGYNAGNEIVTVAPADASSSATMPAIGLVEADILNNTNGSVDNIGRIIGVDTAAFSVGDMLYVSETTGALTNVPPTGGAIIQHIGTVLRSHATQGVINVAAEPTLAAFAETTTTIGALINGATDKATPVDADYVGLMDSAASNVLKKLSWANIKATLKTYFDTIYQAVLVSGTNIKTVNSNSLLGSGNIAVGDVTTTGSQTLTNKTLTAPVITGYTETVYALAGTIIDPANGTIQTKTLSGNTTFTESIADGQSVVLMLNPATYTTTWPTITWITSGGTGAAPTLEASSMNVIVLWQVGGTLYGNWIGSA